MDKFTVLESLVVPLDRANIDMIRIVRGGCATRQEHRREHREEEDHTERERTVACGRWMDERRLDVH